MTHAPQLSICVPSRNRQIYFQHTIRALMASLRTDVEFVFVDNSDDPAIMDDFIAPYIADPRVKYIRSGPSVRSMMDNWEVALEATTGRWITVIGDDDYIDPDLALMIARIEAAVPDVDAVDWERLFYTWPFEGKAPQSVPICMQTEIFELPRKLLWERAFGWKYAREVLTCGFGIYHAAVSRRLMEKIRTVSKARRYFEHPVVDYENILKVIMYGQRFVHCRRPLSVMGICPLSNSAAVGNSRDEVDRAEAFDKELKHPMDSMDCYRTFPFSTRLGVTSTIGMVHHWLSSEYGFNFTGFEKNFVRSCALQCEKYYLRAQFDKAVSNYRHALSIWKDGKYLKYFEPEFKERKPRALFSGRKDDTVYICDASLPVSTPAEYYQLASGILERIDDIRAEPQKYKIAASC